ncbi:MAG: hypothetical protein JWL94_2187 [Microbacteriaceae bacterium]|jgi:hypothetical protein|nr:hypothetical protein [Microbacteriaceae bacterium]HEV7955914.1 hypothetical protein [Marisediminicola sp.]
MDREYEPNLDDDRIVDLIEEDEHKPPLPTLDPDERVEASDEELPPLDDDREEV